jgi:hypothetical protein
VLLAALLVPAYSQAQVFTWSQDEMLKYTTQNPYERFPDGRPKVPDAILEKVKGLSAEDVIGIAGRGYPNQFVDGLQVLRPGKKLVGRAVTLQLMPLRPDLAEIQAAEWKAKGGARLSHQTAIDMLGPGDVLVVDVGGISEPAESSATTWPTTSGRRREPASSSTAPFVISRALPTSTWRGTSRGRRRRRSETSW